MPQSWEEYAKYNRPKAADNKERLIGAMVLWPFSMTGWMVRLPFRGLRIAFNWFYDGLRAV